MVRTDPEFINRGRLQYDEGAHYGEWCWCILDYEDRVVERDEGCEIHLPEE